MSYVFALSSYIFAHIHKNAQLHIRTQVRLCSPIYNKIRYKTYFVAHIRMLSNINCTWCRGISYNFVCFSYNSYTSCERDFHQFFLNKIVAFVADLTYLKNRTYNSQWDSTFTQPIHTGWRSANTADPWNVQSTSSPLEFYQVYSLLYK